MDQKAGTGSRCLCIHSFNLGYDFDELNAPYKDASGYTSQMVLPTHQATHVRHQGNKQQNSKLTP
jgi:hypothetical protein